MMYHYCNLEVVEAHYCNLEGVEGAQQSVLQL